MFRFKPKHILIIFILGVIGSIPTIYKIINDSSKNTHTFNFETNGINQSMQCLNADCQFTMITTDSGKTYAVEKAIEIRPETLMSVRLNKSIQEELITVALAILAYTLFTSLLLVVVHTLLLSMSWFVAHRYRVTYPTFIKENF